VSALRELQLGFMSFLQSQDGDFSDFVIGDETLDTATRLEIYRNAYTTRLKKSIETDHPVLGVYLGDDLFDRLVSGYIASHPSDYSSLREFGESLPDYLACTVPFSDNLILAEIAEFERRLLFAFDAGDTKCTRLGDLQAIAPQDWPDLHVVLHPSVCIFTALWNSVESWQAMRAENAPPAATDNRARRWLIWRGNDRLTQFRPLAVEGEVVFSVLAKGGSFSEACESLLDILPEERISTVAAECLLQWVGDGVISECAAY
jgi:hypothetical protein